MAYPDKPTISTSYTAHEQALGDGSLPGRELDVDFAALRSASEELNDFVRLFARSDGKLQAGVVDRTALGADITLGFEPPRAWATGTDYQVGQTVYEDNKFWICVSAHTASPVFATDSASGRWDMLIDFTDVGGGVYQPASAQLTQIAALGTVAGRMLYTTSAGVWGEAALSAFSRTLLDDADAATARATLGVSIGADVQAHSAALDQISGLGSNTGKYLYTTAANTWTEGTITSFMRGALNSADTTAFIANASLGEACAYNVNTGTDFTLNPAQLATRGAIKGFVDTTLAGYEAADSLDGRWAGFVLASPAGFIGIDTLKVFTLKAVAATLAMNSYVRVRFSTDGGTSWGGWINVSAAPTYNTPNCGIAFTLNLATGEFISIVDGSPPGLAIISSLVVPVGANGIQIGVSNGTFTGAALIIEERA